MIDHLILRLETDPQDGGTRPTAIILPALYTCQMAPPLLRLSCGSSACGFLWSTEGSLRSQQNARSVIETTRQSGLSPIICSVIWRQFFCSIW
jgi:hypothetical protein